MAIRNAAKTIVVNNGKILLIKYESENGFIHYELPGGGQEQFEEMEDAAIREFLEETGYQIRIIRFAAIAEEIFEDKELRKNYPDYVHRIHHIFQAELLSNEVSMDKVLGLDTNQVSCEWMPVENVSEIYLIPDQLKTHIHEIINSNNPIYLGTTHETSNLN